MQYRNRKVVELNMLIDDHYLPDTFDENSKSTCRDVSAEQLSSIVFKIPHDIFSDMSVLHDGTYRADLSALTKADWVKIRHLYILGSSDLYTSHSLVKNNIRPGAYLNKSGDFLLLVKLNETKIQRFLNRYGASVVHFSLGQTRIPALSLNAMPGLETLTLHGNIALTQIEGLDRLERLNRMNVFQCDKLTVLPGLKNLPNLVDLDIRDCRELVTLPEPTYLPALEIVRITACANLATLPSLSGLTGLTELRLCLCEKLSATPDISSLINLTSLYLSDCHDLSELTVLNNVPSLTCLEMHDCKELTTMPDWAKFPNLVTLDLSQSKQLIMLSGVNRLEKLTNLDLSRCNNLRQLRDTQNLVHLTYFSLSRCTSLGTLDISGCCSLKEIHGLNTLLELTTLNLSRCDSVETLCVDISKSALRELILTDCNGLRRLSCYNQSNLAAIVGLNGLRSLANVNLHGCINLKTLDFTGCANLIDLGGLSKLYDLTELNLTNCNRLPELYFAIDEPKRVSSGYELEGVWETANNSKSELVELNLYGCSSLRQVTCINLRKLTKLVGLNSLSTLKWLKLENADKISVFPDLEHLTQLLRLNLISCLSLTALPELGKLVHLMELDLSKCSNLSGLSGLGNLAELNTLNLSECSNLTDLPELGNLGELMKLNLSGCVNLTALPELGKLVHLTELNLSICSKLTKLPGLGNLVRLGELNLAECINLTDLSELGSLGKLTKLNLSGCVNLAALPELGNLAQLVELNLSECGNLTEIPKLGHMKMLTHLTFSGCRKLTKVPMLGCASRIRSLDFSGCSSLRELPSLAKFKQLTELDLSGCSSLTELPDLTGLYSLKKLDLSGSGITQLPDEIVQMKNLEYLDLSNLHLEELPDWLPKIAESYVVDKKGYRRRAGFNGEDRKADVILQDTVVDGVDMSIFHHSRYIIDSWFREQRVPLNEIKVVFLGDGEAGKTHTIARLLNNGGYPKDFDDRSTPGIVIKNKSYTLGGRNIQVHYWDFGGQEILHSMHRIFLTNRTVYVILLNARDNTQGDRARYWLHNVKSFAPGAPVLLVLNKIDQNPNASVDECDLRCRYDKLTRVVRLSARDYNTKQFNQEFTKVLLEEIQNTGFLDASWPIPWTRVKEQLEQMEGHYIMGDAYKAICKKCSVKSNQKKLLHWFNDLGISFCFCDDEDYALKDYVILRPDWITNALYVILFNKCEGAVNGLIPHKAIHDLLTRVGSDPTVRCVLPTARYSTGDIHYVLGIMRKFHLSFPHGTDYEFIPMLCQQNSKIDSKHYRNDPDILEFSMEFDYLPNNLLHRLMVERNQELDMEFVWRTGAKFHQPELGFSAVVIIDGNTLRFFIFHAKNMHRPNTYLAMLKVNVDRIWRKMGLKEPVSNIIYKLDGKTESFDYRRLTKMLEAGQEKEFSMTWNKPLDIADILNQAAPAGLEEERELLKVIVRSCEQIQREPECRGSKEDNRNRRMRDTLQNFGYDPHDQTQMGSSLSGKGVGELDMLLYRKDKSPWSIIEALRVADGTKRDWNEHLGRLLDNYNSHGFPYLFLVTYADCDKPVFDTIWAGYQRRVRNYHSEKFDFVPGSYEVLADMSQNHYVKIARSQYCCGEYVPTVYHIVVQIDLPNK